MKAFKALAVVFLALPLAGASQSVSGGTSPQAKGGKDEQASAHGTVFRLNVRRVPVDVVVTDKRGNPVRGLKPEDFVVKEDSVAQQIVSFDYQDGSTASFVPPKIPPLPTNTFVNLPKEPERGPLYVIFYDMVNTNPDDQMIFRREMLHFVENSQAGTRIALFVNANGLHLLQGFTEDHELLRSVILSKGPGPHIPEVFLYGENFGREDLGAAVSNLQFIAEYLGGIPGRKNLLWLSGKFPVPQGPVFRPVSGTELLDPRGMDPVKHTFAAMMRSQVAVYPVDVKGVVLWEERSPSPAGDAASDFSSTGPPGSRSASANGPNGATGGGGAGGSGGAGGAGAGSNTTSGSAATMQSQTSGQSGYSVTSIDQFQEDFIADSTGGHAYYSNNQVAAAMENAVESGENYYTLSYSPSNAKYDGSDRHIQVSLPGKPEYKLSFRNLYYAVSDDSVEGEHKREPLQARFLAAKEQDPLFANIEHGAPMLHDLLFSAHFAVAGPPVKATAEQMQQLADAPAYFSKHGGHKGKILSAVPVQRVLIDYGVIDPKLKALAARDEKQPTLEFAAAAYDLDGRLLNSILNQGEASGQPAPGGRSSALFHAEQELAVPAGAAWIRVAVRDKLDNRTGTLEVPLPLKSEMMAGLPGKQN